MHAVVRVAAVAAVLALVLSCAEKTPLQPGPTASTPTNIQSSPKIDAERTPFQQSVAKTIAERQTDGLPVPTDVSFSYTSDAGTAAAGVEQQGPQPGDQVTIVATTVIRFDHPSQAGNARWPDLVVEGDVPANGEGFVHGGDYSQTMREQLAQAIPEIWNQYEFGYEPRTYTVVEEYEVTYPDSAAGSTTSSTPTTLNEILLGINVAGPKQSGTVQTSFEVLGVPVMHFAAGVTLDWALDIRLPMETSITCPDPMLEGSTYQPMSTVRGLDWTADDFLQAGIAAENGNEFVMHFKFTGVAALDLFGTDVMNVGTHEALERSSSFATPLGSGAPFALPSIDATIWDLEAGVANGQVGLRVTPQAGSDKLCAAWTTLCPGPGQISGCGNLLYTDPNTNVQHGPVVALDGPGLGHIQMQDFRYFFDDFVLDLGLTLSLNVYGMWNGTFEIPITDFDLSALTGSMCVGQHCGTPGCHGICVSIQNVAPTAQIDLRGAAMVQGVPAFVVHAGGPLVLSGRSVDPGLDDLTLLWDWGDGNPSPDVSTRYPVPHDITELQTHAFGDARLHFVRFKSVDDDLDSGQHLVTVVVTGPAGTLPRYAGFWQHQCRGNGQVVYDTAALENFLETIEFMSAVFSETRDISSAAQAFDVLFLKGNGGSASEHFDRELLVTWFNFASGAFDLETPLDTDHNGRGDTTFADVVHEAEMVRLDPNATAKALRQQAEILHDIEEMASELPDDAPLVGSQ